MTIVRKNVCERTYILYQQHSFFFYSTLGRSWNVDVMCHVRAQNKGGHRTMTGRKCLLTGHFFTSPVILTGHICMPSDRILNRFFSSAYLLKSCQRKTVYFMASTQFHCKYVKLCTTKTLFVLVIYNVIANVLSV